MVALVVLLAVKLDHMLPVLLQHREVAYSS